MGFSRSAMITEPSERGKRRMKREALLKGVPSLVPQQVCVDLNSALLTLHGVFPLFLLGVCSKWRLGYGGFCDGHESLAAVSKCGDVTKRSIRKHYPLIIAFWTAWKYFRSEYEHKGNHRGQCVGRGCPPLQLCACTLCALEIRSDVHIAFNRGVFHLVFIGDSINTLPMQSSCKLWDDAKRKKMRHMGFLLMRNFQWNIQVNTGFSAGR